MPLTDQEFATLVARLRSGDLGENPALEVKSGVGGFPESVMPTLSALANLPGGGIILVGLQEDQNYAPVPLSDLSALKQGFGTRARQFTPPLTVTLGDHKVEGHTVVAVEVAECDRAMKPCRITSSGKSYLRSHDGDYELSELEIQGFLANRSQPRSDREAVTSSSRSDFDPDVVAQWHSTVKQLNPHGLGRFTAVEDALLRSGALTEDGVPTVAGILAFGVYPQQFFPQCVIRAAAAPRDGDERSIRVRNARVCDGPLPLMVDSAMEWIAANIDYRIVGNAQGRVRDDYVYPLEAVRELVVNAVIHRDLSAWALGQATEIRAYSHRLVIANPGGLYGITVERLGKENLTSARNSVLVNIAQYLRLPSDGSRLVEALATGLTKVTQELAWAGLPAAEYYDQGIRFTVSLRQKERSKPRPVVSTPQEFPPPDSILDQVYQALQRSDGYTLEELVAATQLNKTQLRRSLQVLRNDPYNLVESTGRRGPGGGRYRVKDHAADFNAGGEGNNRSWKREDLYE